MKSIRQNAILEIIMSQDIETQNGLLDALLKAGISSTQATISRDIKELGLVKELTPAGGYRYAPAKRKEALNHSLRLKAIFKESVTSLACAQNIVVIKTLPGLAPAACSAIDAMNIRGLVGTLAGDDTAFLAMCDNDTANAFCSDIEAML
ncbi:MAG: arginine repressor [Oscillospiraceae bacterium]|nr:arginine repressor [Oscillospiraceae bacterium]